MKYESFLEQLNRNKALGAESSWRIVDVQKQQDIVCLENKTNGKAVKLKISTLIHNVMAEGCYVSNSSLLKNCSVFKNDAYIVVKLKVQTESGKDVEVLKIKTNDGKTKQEVESILYEIAKKAEKCSCARYRTQLSREEQEIFSMLRLYGYTIEFFVNVMMKLFGWKVTSVEYDTCVEL